MGTYVYATSTDIKININSAVAQSTIKKGLCLISVTFEVAIDVN